MVLRIEDVYTKEQCKRMEEHADKQNRAIDSMDEWIKSKKVYEGDFRNVWQCSECGCVHRDIGEAKECCDSNIEERYFCTIHRELFDKKPENHDQCY